MNRTSRRSNALLAAVFTVAPLLVIATTGSAGCGSSKAPFVDDGDAGSSGTSGTSGTSGSSGFGGDASGDATAVLVGDPETCEEAKTARTYVGCDYWPTVTANNVWSIFDFAVVVSNVSKSPAMVTVTGPNATNKTVTVAPGTLEKIYLPWVASLKGADWNALTAAVALPASVVETGGAYHVVSSVPVVVYQFNALEYQPKGGPSGKSWSACPNAVGFDECFSYSNDASLLIPSTAWTQSYRVTGVKGWSTSGQDVTGGYIVVTASQANTNVTVSLSATGSVLAGGGIPATSGGGKITKTLNAGDAMELVTPKGAQFDLSGSLVTSDKPIEVFTGIPCVNVPADKQACDHVEESVVPAESLGKEYVVTTPTKPKGGTGVHVVRFYGNRDGTTLTYTPTKPAGCPDSLTAGQVAECVSVDKDFVVKGTQEFGISSFGVGSVVYDPNGLDSRGDPDQTTYASVEQFRVKYLFLAPDDYDVSYAVISGPEGANVTLDGKVLSGFTAIGSGHGVWRATLGPGGTHSLTSDMPVGLQVMGYGANTSYTYPGGLDLKAIAPPPVVK